MKYSQTWPSETLRTSDAILIRYIAGYGATAASVPEEVKLAMLMMIGHFYENREATFDRILREVPHVKELLDINRRNWFGGW